MNLLLVDDEVVSIQGLLAGVNWEKCGIDRVFTAYSAKEAKKIILSEEINLALLDIEMPEEDGIALLRWLRSVETVPVSCAFLTCHAQFAYAKEAITLRCSEYLLKPLEYAEVEALIIRMVSDLQEENRKKRLKQYVEKWEKDRVSALMESTPETPDSKAIVEEATAYILEHLTDNDLFVRDIAAYVHLNPDYLNRLFKKQKGISINSFIIEERMRLAMKLMTEGNMSATGAAQAVGYQQYANFVNMFKKKYGKLPSQFTEDKRESGNE